MWKCVRYWVLYLWRWFVMPRGNVVLGKFKGVNLALDPKDLEDDELAFAQNYYPAKAGQLVPRPRTALFNAVGFGSPYPEPVPQHALFQFEGKDGHRTLIWSHYFDGRYVLADFFPGTVGGARVIQTNTSAAGQLRQQKPAAVAWQDSLYLFPGGGEPGFWFTSLPLPKTSADFSTTRNSLAPVWGADAPIPTVAFMYRSQMVLCGFAPNQAGLASSGGADTALVRFCDVNLPGTLLVPAKSIYVNRDDNDYFTGGIEVTVEGGGTYFEPYAILFKKNSVWMLQGPPPTSGTTGGLALVSIMRGEGLVAKETLARSKYGILWCSGKNVYIAANGQKPVAIGDAIQPLLKTLPQNSDLWNGVFFDGFYRLTVPGSRAVPEYASGVAAAYSGGGQERACEQWWCDLRDFDKDGSVTWWGPMTIPALSQMVENLPDGTQRLIGTWLSNTGTPITGFIADSTDGASATTYAGGDAIGCPVASTGTPMTSLARFKEMDFGDPMLQKLVQSLEVYCSRLGANSNLKAGVQLNGGAPGFQSTASNDLAATSNTYTWTNGSNTGTVTIAGASRVFTLGLTNTGANGNPGAQVHIFVDGVDLKPAGYTLPGPNIPVPLDTFGTVTPAVLTGASISFGAGTYAGLPVFSQVVPIQSIAAAGSFILDLSTLDTGVLANEFKAYAFRPAGGARPVGYTIQPYVVNGPYAGDTAASSLDVVVRSIGLEVRPIGRRPT